jgi:lipoprotein-anchoring transpeptidase ErfK/SrfK
MKLTRAGRAAILFGLLVFLAACGGKPDVAKNHTGEVVGYGVLQDGEYTLPAVDAKYLQGVNKSVIVPYLAPDAPGTIVVDPFAKFLFVVQPDGTAWRYPIAVGREGRGFRGDAVIGRKELWPGWTPTANMLRQEPEVYGDYRGGIPGGLASPLGARALYLYRGGKDTRYRIHGTNDLESIGNAGSAGCIRMFNHDVIDIYNSIEMGTRVHVRTYEESVQYEGEELANRGVELPPRIIPHDELLGGAETVAEAEAEQQPAG